MARILLAGESWNTTSIHTKGFDVFTSVAYEEGAGHFLAAFEETDHTVTFLPNHVAAGAFPHTPEQLSDYDLVVLSDIGSNTLLLPNSVFLRGERAPANRLESLATWVEAGGSLLMVGGYLSFSGIEAKANYRATPLSRVLPVEMEVGDDREETPEGIAPRVTAEHPVVTGLEAEWPAILGYQRLVARAGTETLVEVGAGHPLVVVGSAGAGRVAAVATDMGPHWLPPEFLAWDGFPRLWRQLADWLIA